MLIVGNLQESGEEDDKKMMRIIHKKSQTVTQAHMCNYCNYTSPKRLDRKVLVEYVRFGVFQFINDFCIA